jgi:hypothetical protein
MNVRHLQHSRKQPGLPPSLWLSVRVFYWPNQVGVRRRHQLAPTRGLIQPMILSHDITNTSSKMEALLFWCVGFNQESGVYTRFISEIICRLMEHSIVSIDIFFLETLSTSPPSLTSSVSVTTKPSLSPYHSADVECKDLDAFLYFISRVRILVHYPSA